MGQLRKPSPATYSRPALLLAWENLKELDLSRYCIDGYEKLRNSCGVFLLGMGSPNFAFSRPIRLKTKLGVLGLPFLTTKIS